MFNVLYMILVLFLLSWLIVSFTFIFYVAVMHFKKVKDKLSKPVKIIAAPAITFGIVIYIFMNLTVGSLIFLEFPKSLQFTARCERHLKVRNGSWRYRQAVWWCSLLGIFEKNHCKGS